MGRSRLLRSLRICVLREFSKGERTPLVVAVLNNRSS